MSCVLWNGRLDRYGYGIFGGRLVHRLVYRNRFGGIPDGFHVHHECRQKACINPEHLRLVTPGDHTRLHGAEKTHCVNGHEYTPSNTYRRPSGGRDCRICTCDRQRKYRGRRAA